MPASTVDDSPSHRPTGIVWPPAFRARRMARLPGLGPRALLPLGTTHGSHSDERRAPVSPVRIGLPPFHPKRDPVRAFGQIVADPHAASSPILAFTPHFLTA